MNKNLKTLSMVEAAMVSGILVIFAFISTMVFPIIMLLYPLPAIILGKRRGTRYCVMSLVAADIIVFILLGAYQGVMCFFMFSPVAAVMSYMICKDENVMKVVLYSSIAFMISMIIMLIGLQVFMGVGLIDQLSEVMKQSMEMYSNMFGNKEIPESVRASVGNVKTYGEYFANMAQMYVATINLLLPDIIIAASIMVSALNYFVASKFAKRLSIDMVQFAGFDSFSFPKTFIISMAALLLLSYGLKIFNIDTYIVQQNLLFLCLMAMFLQGFSVVRFYLKKFNVSKFLSVITTIFVIFSPLMFQLLIFAGAGDLIFDFRKLR